MFIHGFGETVRIYGEIREEGIRSRTNSNYLSRYGNWFVLCFFFEYFAALWNTRRFQFYHLSVGIQNLLSQRRIADDIMDISCRYLT